MYKIHNCKEVYVISIDNKSYYFFYAHYDSNYSVFRL